MSTYISPPVHEVILDVWFAEALAEVDVARVPTLLGGQWVRVGSNAIEISPLGAPRILESGFSHWMSDTFEDECRWVVRIAANKVTLNVVRPGAWPEGRYVGWSSVLRHWQATLHPLNSMFAAPIHRAGVRYVNKIALPAGAELSAWLNMRLLAPSLLREPMSFQLRQSWASIDGHDGLAANVIAARLPREETPVGVGLGLALDVDVFNKQEHPPSYTGIIDWFERAHAAENAIFEACLKDDLRIMLGESS